jgi:ABC-type lipoprotein export system ATPase subunit
MVRTENLVKDYTTRGEVVHALKDADITAVEGTITLFMGPSGSGKSTALKIIGGLLSATGGTVDVGDYHLLEMSERELCSYRFSETGMVFQDFLILDHLSVWDNVLLSVRVGKKKDIGSEKDYYPRTEELLRDLGLWDMRKRKASSLSGGQRQRVAIARALLKKPGVLLADEPTANLDTDTAVSVIELFREMTVKNNTVTIIATHDERLAGYADSVYDFMDGTVKKR